MYVLDQYRGTSSSCRYDIPPRMAGPELLDELVRVVEAAIVDVVMEQPILQVGIKNADSKSPMWVQLESLNVRDHISWQFLDSSKDLEVVSQETTASEVDGLFPDLHCRPGWRVVILHQHSTAMLEIQFTWNHPHGDGISGKIFQEHLARRLNTREISNETLRALDSAIIKLPEGAPALPPPIEDVCKLPITVGYTLKMIWEELGPASLSWTRPSLARWAPFQMSPYKTQFRAFTLEYETLEKILSSCRRESTTLTGLLHGLTLVSLASQLREAAPTLEGGTTVDLRRFLPSDSSHPGLKSKKIMGNYVTLMAHIFDEELVKEVHSQVPVDRAAGDSLPVEVINLVWSTASKVRDEIKQKLAAGLKNDTVGVMKFVGDWRKQMVDAAKRPRQFSWWITGVGVLEGNPTLDYKSPSSTEQGRDSTWIVRRAQFAL